MPAPACLLKRVVFSSWSWQLLQVTAGTCRLNLYSCIIPASENFLKNLYVNKELPYIALPHARCCKIAPSSHVMHAGFTVHVAVQPPRALPLLHLAVSPGGLKRRQGKKKDLQILRRGEEDEEENEDGQANRTDHQQTSAESTAACPAADTRATARLFDLGHRPANMLPVASSSDGA